ncbi:MAG: biotin-dependent carboxyltransferase family protein [Candidatus Viridilinea halotolerans]|uniref:Biotin-dependent carboxyltransferase family protein n=1 Tax=Candidatus Viridilinea halotolerans TaxID=2491704 RepID=A0A426TYZ2_9CHLR|nr:MAG: biotin-dependent carboxyltransferase family protein [Candidatus Viridilinea halotolerans]
MHIHVISPGLLTTIQDSGRPAARRYGVPPSGAMDMFALAVANRLIGNPSDAAALELTAGGALLEFLRPTLVALTGADLGATLNGRHLAPWQAALLDRGTTLHFRGRQANWGARAYLALAGGIAAPTLLGSRSTYLAGGFGGLEGRALRPGDQLATYASPHSRWPWVGTEWPCHARPLYGHTPTLRFLPGPHYAALTPAAREALSQTTLRVGAAANRIGYRLDGLRLSFSQQLSLPSFGVIAGAIQVPPDGTPILLMAEAQTIGGYPVVAIVIAPDLPLAAQILPGDQLRLAPTTMRAARAAHQRYAAWLATAPQADPWPEQLALAGALG